MTVELARLTIMGEPRPKARARVVKGHAYTPKATKEFEALIREVWDSVPRPDMAECVRLDVVFFRSTRQHCDVDNLLKSVKDALNGRAYSDDWRVHDVRGRKHYTEKGRARTEVVVYAIDPDRNERI
jgi:Holliday junction resolvase RusA-like endonuclease